jgi:O-antigen/teichoic acid export membrane protein
VIRHVSLHRARGEPHEVDRVVAASVAIVAALAVLVLPLVALLARFGPALFDPGPELRESLAHAIWLVGLAALLAFPKRILFAVIEGHQRFDLLNLCSVSGALLGALLSVAVVLRGGGLIALMVVLLAQLVYEVAVESWIVVRLLGVRPRPRGVRREDLRRLLGYSYYAFLIDVAVGIAHRIDTAVIAAFLSPGAITFYTVGTRIAGVVEKLTAPLIDTFFPLASDLHTAKEDARLQRLLLEGTRLTVLLTAPCVVVIGWYGDDLIRWWVGPDYVAQSLPVLRIFLAVVFLAVFESTSARILLGVGRVKFDANVSLATAGANLVLSLLLVRSHGLVGVALGTLIPMAVANLCVSVPYTCALTGTPVLRLYGAVLLPLAAIVVPAVAAATLSERFIRMPAAALAVGAAAAGLATLAVLARSVDLRGLTRALVARR